ncbi:hypothetical protein KKC94_04435 [Patescibacteria group bacterium]|nr:hypothetical protein [Patescibacteria group bacterium]
MDRKNEIEVRAEGASLAPDSSDGVFASLRRSGAINAAFGAAALLAANVADAKPDSYERVQAERSESAEATFQLLSQLPELNKELGEKFDLALWEGIMRKLVATHVTVLDTDILNTLGEDEDGTGPVLNIEFEQDPFFQKLSAAANAYIQAGGDTRLVNELFSQFKADRLAALDRMYAAKVEVQKKLEKKAKTEGSSAYNRAVTEANVLEKLRKDMAEFEPSRMSFEKPNPGRRNEEAIQRYGGPEQKKVYEKIIFMSNAGLPAERQREILEDMYDSLQARYEQLRDQGNPGGSERTGGRVLDNKEAELIEQRDELYAKIAENPSIDVGSIQSQIDELDKRIADVQKEAATVNPAAVDPQLADVNEAMLHILQYQQELEKMEKARPAGGPSGAVDFARRDFDIDFMTQDGRDGAAPLMVEYATPGVSRDYSLKSLSPLHWEQEADPTFKKAMEDFVAMFITHYDREIRGYHIALQNADPKAESKLTQRGLIMEALRLATEDMARPTATIRKVGVATQEVPFAEYLQDADLKPSDLHSIAVFDRALKYGAIKLDDSYMWTLVRQDTADQIASTLATDGNAEQCYVVPENYRLGAASAICEKIKEPIKWDCQCSDRKIEKTLCERFSVVGDAEDKNAVASCRLTEENFVIDLKKFGEVVAELNLISAVYDYLGE